jgi:Photosynthetic reaction centre cytochrome C subunit
MTMKFQIKGLMLVLAFMGLAGLTWVDRAKGQDNQVSKDATAKAANAKGMNAGQFFKNVTSSTLKGLTPSDFLGAMGVMTAAVGYDCLDCHPGAGTDAMDWVTDSNPKKVTARKMVEMVATINKQNFAGTQQVTCWTCHHGLDQPTTSIALDKLYGEPNDEKRDVLAAGAGVKSADVVLDEFIQATGGAQKWATVKSYMLMGKEEYYGGLGGDGHVEIYAQAPNSRGMWINFPDHPDRGTSAWTYDGKTGWISQPRGFMGKYELTGNDLNGQRLDSIVGFPTEIKGAFPRWVAGLDDDLNGKDVHIIQGSVPGGILGTFYFDTKTHYLIRMVRRTPSPVGRVTIQEDFDDYRDVNGVKLPFTYSFLWLDGRFTAKMTDAKLNVTVPAEKIGRP